MDSLRRIAEFEHRFAVAQATDVVDLGWGHALLQRDYPASWHHNRVVVTDAADPADVLAAADSVLGDHGHTHRLVQFADTDAGAAAEPAFASAGYGSHDRIVTMIHSGELPASRGAPAEAVSFAHLRPRLIRDWAEEFPAHTDEENTQLADRVQLYSLGADVTFLAVLDETGDVLARGELYVRDGVAQFENIVTRPGHRGRGHARALVHEALHRGADAGADLWFLIAEASDWPITWYRRLGYQDAHETHVYLRNPD